MLQLSLKIEIEKAFQQVLSKTIDEDPSVYMLAKEVDEFEKVVGERKKSLSAAWLSTASQLISEARSFIKIIKNHDEVSHKIYLKAAIRYLVAKDDVIDDFTDDGLKDDAFLFFEIMHGLKIEYLVNQYHKHSFKLSS